jgi:hypothetical protein
MWILVDLAGLPDTAMLEKAVLVHPNRRRISPVAQT